MNTIPSLSDIFGIPVRLAHSPKMPKEPQARPVPTHALSNSALINRLMIKKNKASVQHAICISRKIAVNLKFSTFNKNIEIRDRESLPIE